MANKENKALLNRIGRGERNLIELRGEWGGAKLPKGRDNDINVTMYIKNTKSNQHRIAELEQGDSLHILGYQSEEQSDIEDKDEDENPDQTTIPDTEEDEEDAA